jgi:prepilin-type N-terminal cleavage/methylation domain-containing protein
MSKYMNEERDERGFTLIELLVAIVVVGILAAVAIVGIGGLTGTANHASCKATKDAATAAATSYFADHDQTWPGPGSTPATDFSSLTTGNYLKLDNGVHVDGTDATILDAPGATPAWTITMTQGGATETVLTGSAGC